MLYAEIYCTGKMPRPSWSTLIKHRPSLHVILRLILEPHFIVGQLFGNLRAAEHRTGEHASGFIMATKQKEDH